MLAGLTLRAPLHQSSELSLYASTPPWTLGLYAALFLWPLSFRPRDFDPCANELPARWKCDPRCQATPRTRALGTLPLNPAQRRSQEVPAWMWFAVLDVEAKGTGLCGLWPLGFCMWAAGTLLLLLLLLFVLFGPFFRLSLFLPRSSLWCFHLLSKQIMWK